MYEYVIHENTEVDLELLEEKLKAERTLLIFRLRDDYINQLTIERLLESFSPDQHWVIVDITMESQKVSVDYFHLERLPKFYFYNNGEVVKTISGSISKSKLENYMYQMKAA